jgi:hypothetical protein
MGCAAGVVCVFDPQAASASAPANTKKRGFTPGDLPRRITRGETTVRRRRARGVRMVRTVRRSPNAGMGRSAPRRCRTRGRARRGCGVRERGAPSGRDARGCGFDRESAHSCLFGTVSLLVECAAVAFTRNKGLGHHYGLHFEAPSHGPQARCLRFAYRRHRHQRKTRFRMAGTPCPGGPQARMGSHESFSVMHSLSPG